MIVKVLADELTKRYNKPDEPPVVVIGAPTGIAAVGIEGTTLHSLLKLEVQQGSIGEYHALKPTQLSKLKHQLSKVKLFVMDEFSMVANTMLVKIHLRLCEISGNYSLRKYNNLKS